MRGMTRTISDREQFDQLLRECTNYERLPAFHAGRVRVDLERMRLLAGRLGHPQRVAPTAHVTGTKGKGSTATLLARILSRAAGPTGLHVSPHLHRMEERVSVDGVPIGEAALFSVTNEILAAVGDDPDPGFPTFFEFITLAAFLHFRNRRVAFAVHEAGMGGRLDATNIVAPAVTVITNVGLEHTAVLGESVEAIAAEKAGIVKPGAPLLTAIPADSAALRVVRAVAAEAGVACLRLGEEIELSRTGGSDWQVSTPARTYSCPGDRLPGRFQGENLALAVAAAEQLVPDLDPEAVEEALRDAVLPGRFERVGSAPELILDGAHTKESIALVLDEAARRARGGPLVLLLALAADKDVTGAARLVARAGPVITTGYDSPRACDPHELSEQVRLAGGRAEPIEDPARALQRARQLADKEGTVLVIGSIYLAGLVRALVLGSPTEEGSSPWST